MKDSNVLDFLAEAGMLKRIKRSGWWMVGIPHEESVAEHSFRCAVIGYALAKLEKADPYKVLVMSIFGDLPEARINDQHKVASGYLDVRGAEKKAFTDQIEELPEDMRSELGAARGDYDAQDTPESIVARDADILECLMQAKEYVDMGFANAGKFFKKAPDHLKTESAKKLWNRMKEWDSNCWWERLSRFER